MAVGKNKATSASKATPAIDNWKGRVQRKVLVERGARFRCAIRCVHRKGAPDGKPTPNAETERTSTATLQQAGLTLGQGGRWGPTTLPLCQKWVGPSAHTGQNLVAAMATVAT